MALSVNATARALVVPVGKMAVMHRYPYARLITQHVPASNHTMEKRGREAARGGAPGGVSDGLGAGVLCVAGGRGGGGDSGK